MSFVRVKALRLIAADSTMPMRELVTALGTDAAYTTVVLDDLEKRGFVTRAPHPDDRRAKLVTATARGAGPPGRPTPSWTGRRRRSSGSPPPTWPNSTASLPC